MSSWILMVRARLLLLEDAARVVPDLAGFTVANLLEHGLGSIAHRALRALIGHVFAFVAEARCDCASSSASVIFTDCGTSTPTLHVSHCPSSL